MPEPIYWASNKAAAARKIPAKRFNPATGQMDDAFDDETGERLYERIPQRGHVGGDYDNPIAGKARWMHVLRHDGHTVRVPLTCAAADYDFSQLTSQERRAKARHFGWIPVGHCPLALIQAGELKQPQLVSKELRALPPSDACASGTYSEVKHCKHYLAELDARRLLQSKKTAQIDRPTEADKMIAAQREQTEKLVGTLSDALKGPKSKP